MFVSDGLHPRPIGPYEYWEKVELHLSETRHEFHDLPHGDNAALDAYESRLRGFIADELDASWFCARRLSVQGSFGELGKKVVPEIWDYQRPKPASVWIELAPYVSHSVHFEPGTHTLRFACPSSSTSTRYGSSINASRLLVLLAHCSGLVPSAKAAADMN